MKDYFPDHEIECKCGCGAKNLHPDTRRKLNVARELAGIPFVPVSACRCPKHNKAEGGKDHSAHVTTPEQDCRAMDIATPDSRTRYKVLTALLKAGFTRIGIAKTFIHADDGEGAPYAPEVAWLY